MRWLAEDQFAKRTDGKDLVLDAEVDDQITGKRGMARQRDQPAGLMRIEPQLQRAARIRRVLPETRPEPVSSFDFCHCFVIRHLSFQRRSPNRGCGQHPLPGRMLPKGFGPKPVAMAVLTFPAKTQVAVDGHFPAHPAQVSP